jgi:cysteinyl-tRNA synthetase
VTEHLPSIVEITEKLIANGKAYEVDGEVLYSVRSFPDYGKLSKRDIEDVRTGTRVEPGEKKRDVLDFALVEAGETRRAVMAIALGRRGGPGGTLNVRQW